VDAADALEACAGEAAEPPCTEIPTAGERLDEQVAHDRRELHAAVGIRDEIEVSRRHSAPTNRDGSAAREPPPIAAGPR